eukprot:gene173-62_t
MLLEEVVRVSRERRVLGGSFLTPANLRPLRMTRRRRRVPGATALDDLGCRRRPPGEGRGSVELRQEGPEGGPGEQQGMEEMTCELPAHGARLPELGSARNELLDAFHWLQR